MPLQAVGSPSSASFASALGSSAGLKVQEHDILYSSISPCSQKHTLVHYTLLTSVNFTDSGGKPRTPASAASKWFLSGVGPSTWNRTPNRLVSGARMGRSSSETGRTGCLDRGCDMRAKLESTRAKGEPSGFGGGGGGRIDGKEVDGHGALLGGLMGDSGLT